ncbi:MAG: prepilin peptidase [Candidatus Bathyarchaeota archaeon]|nr:MAG: prepilin peptidase [Candidatus Bathyarchaeota archaeon]
MDQILSWVRVTITLAFLSYASWSDFKTREVSNNVWAVFAPTAFLLTCVQLLVFPPIGDVLLSMMYYGLSFALTSAFSVALFYVGAFGGADAKALMCIALAIPEPSVLGALSDFFSSTLQVSFPLSGFVSFVFPITVFSNGVIVAAFSVFYALFRNLLWRQRTGQELFEGYRNESFGRKALTLLCGYKVSVADLRKSFLYPLEDFRAAQSGEMERCLLLFPREENREEIIERLVAAERGGKLQKTVWATPGLPMLIFITVGLILALTIGDVVWIVISRILG